MKLIQRIGRFSRNYLIDRRYGAFIGGTKKTPFAAAGANDTANVSYRELPPLFNGIVRPDDILVDVGCGRGRVLNWWLDHYPGHRIYGIELDSEVADQVAERLREHPVIVLAGDARMVVPPDGSLFFAYNPFNAEVMIGFLEALKRRAAPGARVIYYNCIHLDVFEADKDCSVVPIQMPKGCHKAAMITIGAPRG
ncbi:class I SAM-dependent methyltransferase [Nonomuraea sp. NBC_01738]|uniref:SAM-dependent methyltransferase n=1 Tax=Nonomuraea sp. NBC_01738 TaxID=2976003 RepID=UPI002E168336|nr:class I SAM-dependent methyltransferase [Nonomuraea sp. NBC_01738]